MNNHTDTGTGTDITDGTQPKSETGVSNIGISDEIVRPEDVERVFGDTAQAAEVVDQNTSDQSQEIHRLRYILVQRKKALIGCKSRLLKAEKDKDSLDRLVSDTARSNINERYESALSNKANVEIQVSETEETLKALLGEEWSSFLAGVEAEVQENIKVTETPPVINRGASIGLPPDTNLNQGVAKMRRKTIWMIIAAVCLLALIVVGMTCLPSLFANRPASTNPASEVVPTVTPSATVPVVVSGVPSSEVIDEEKLPHGSLVGPGCLVIGDGMCAAGKDTHNIHGKKETENQKLTFEGKPEICEKGKSTKKPKKHKPKHLSNETTSDHLADGRSEKLPPEKYAIWFNRHPEIRPLMACYHSRKLNDVELRKMMSDKRCLLDGGTIPLKEGQSIADWSNEIALDFYEEVTAKNYKRLKGARWAGEIRDSP